MATMINYLSLTGLNQYDLKIKEFIAAKVAEGDAPSFKYVDLNNGVLKFYNVNPITEYSEPVFEIELPEQDLSHLMALVEGAVAGNIAVFGENGQVVDTGIKAEDLATKTDVQTVQDSVDELSELVGVLPEGTTATSVVDYVNIKTAGIATDAALEELNNQVSGLQTAVQGIQADYLVKADKDELQGEINTNADAIAAIKEDVDAFFKDADMTESAKDTLKELQEYIASDETGAAAMAASIKQNSDDIDALEGTVATKAAQADLEAEVEAREALDARVVTLEGIDHEAYVGADATLKSELQAEINKKADASVVTALDEAYKAADQTLSGRIDALEGVSHSHENEEVLGGITAEKVAAWDAAETNAKTYANEEIAKIDLSGITTNANDISEMKEDIAELQAVEHVEITEAQINALFDAE